jgi:flagellar motor protein MotB
VRPDRSQAGEREEPRARVAPDRPAPAPNLPLEVLARMPVRLPGRGGQPALAALVRSAGPILGNQALQRVIAPGRAQPGNMLARRLIATGDVDRFRAMAEPASGLQLLLDPVTNELTAVGSLVDPATSPSFATELTTIMDDPLQDAEVHFGAGQPGVLGGAFPNPRDLSASTVQRIDMDDMEALEAGVPGFGVTALAHELAENFEAHSHLPAPPGTDLFPAAHAAGIQAENAVISELVGPGGRIAERSFVDPVTGDIRAAFDYENYYIVIDAAPAASVAGGGTDFQIRGTRQAARNPLNDHTIDRYVTGRDTPPAGGAAAVAAAVADLQGSQNSTAIIEGFCDDVGAAGVNDPLSQRRADKIRAAIIALDPTLRSALHPAGRGATNFVAGNATEAERAQNRRVTITITEPAP